MFLIFERIGKKNWTVEIRTVKNAPKYAEHNDVYQLRDAMSIESAQIAEVVGFRV